MTDTKKSAGKKISLVITVALLFLMTAAIIPGVIGASNVDLGSAGNYAILAKSGITTTGATKITGNIGVSPIAASSMTGFALSMDASNQFSRSSLVTGGVYASNYAPPTPATMTTAISAMETAYTTAAGRPTSNVAELFAGNLGGKTLAPGVYKWSSGVLIPPADTLTLDAQGDGNAVWIFQVAGDLTMNSASRIVLSNGANANNVYWQIAGPTGVKIGSGAHIEGNILAQKAITMDSGASLNGRALAQTAVTLIANTVTAPTSSAIIPAQTVAPGQYPSPSQTAVPGQTIAPGHYPAPGQTIAPGQTYAPGQTIPPGQFAPTQTAVPTQTGPRGVSSVRIANVGGNTVVDFVEVLGTGHNDLIVTGYEAYEPGMDMATPPGTVFHYFDLKPARYTTIDNSLVSFAVPVSWLEDHNINPQDVTVYQNYNNQSWTARSTLFLKIDGSQARYSVSTPDLNSRFVITGQVSPYATWVQTAEPTSSPSVTYYAPIVPTVAQIAPAMMAPTQSPLPVWVPISAVIGSLMIIAVFSGRRGKNS
ncbi:MAG: ice-binding family protein [Methanoregula sp.]